MNSDANGPMVDSRGDVDRLTQEVQRLSQENDVLRKEIDTLQAERGTSLRQATYSLLRKQFPESSWSDFDPADYTLSADDALAELQGMLKK